MAQGQNMDSRATRKSPWLAPPQRSIPWPGGYGRAAVLRGMVLLSLSVILADLAIQRTVAQDAAKPAAPSPPTGSSSRFGAASEERLVEQKLRLLETYLETVESGRFAQTGDPKIKAFIAEAREHLDAAQQAFSGGDFALAASLTDQGLRSLGRASSTAGRPKPREDEARSLERLTTLRRQIQGYLATLTAMLQEPELKAAHGPALQRIEDLVERSTELEKAKSYAEANAALAEAYPITLKIVSELHQGRTLVARLEFASPEEEFSYEQRRYESYELLVSLALDSQGEENRISNDAMTKRFLTAGRTLRAQAEEEAREGNYGTSIQTLEQATQQLVYALQASGVQVLY